MSLVVAAPDKFGGTLSAPAAARACAAGARRAGWHAVELPLSDGGEGLLDVVGGTEQFTEVLGPLSDTVRARWRLVEDPVGTATAVIEMAEASGLSRISSNADDRALAATTFGTGQLIVAALERGAKRIILGCGGSATTDGGAGALEALGDVQQLDDVELIVAVDVRTRFLDAPAVFGPQKGARAQDIPVLEHRLSQLAEHYQARFGVDVRNVEGAGAAGGLAGGLLAIGGKIVGGFDYIADLIGLDAALAQADAVITGEGRLDTTSFDGKVVGSVLHRVAATCPTLVVVGDATYDRAFDDSVTVVSLVAHFGLDEALSRPDELIPEVAEHWLTGLECGN